MKLGLKLEYACRVALQLAATYDGKRVSRVEDLAERESVSANFLVQILNDLRRAGLVASRRGKLGGYTLARPPAEITLADVVQAIEGGILELDRAEGKGQFGPRVVQVWKRIGSELQESLERHSLADLASTAATPDYMI